MIRMISRVVLGTLGLLVYLMGRGARVSAQRLDSMPEYVISVVAQLLGATLLLFVLVIWRRSRLGGPRKRSHWTGLTAVGWLHFAMAGLIIWAMASLIGMANQVGSTLGTIAGSIVDTPDLFIKLVTGVLVAGAGATALSGAKMAWPLLRVTAVPLSLIWPHGFMLAAWSAWSSISAKDAASPGGKEVPMRIEFNEASWKVSRQLPSVGWRAEGEGPPLPQESGLWFHSDRGEKSFLAMDLDQLPTQEQVDTMTLDDFVPLFTRATPR